MLNKLILHKAAARDASEAVVPASSFSMDWWRQLRLWWQRFGCFGRRAPRRLRLCESLPLGERRFVAVVEFERSRFLVGGTSSSLVLLAHLGNGQARGKDAKHEQGQGPERNEEKDKDKNKNNQTDGIAADRPAAKGIHGSVHP